MKKYFFSVFLNFFNEKRAKKTSLSKKIQKKNLKKGSSTNSAIGVGSVREAVRRHVRIGNRRVREHTVALFVAETTVLLVTQQNARIWRKFGSRNEKKRKFFSICLIPCISSGIIVLDDVGSWFKDGTLNRESSSSGHWKSLIIDFLKNFFPEIYIIILRTLLSSSRFPHTRFQFFSVISWLRRQKFVCSEVFFTRITRENVRIDRTFVFCRFSDFQKKWKNPEISENYEKKNFFSLFLKKIFLWFFEFAETKKFRQKIRFSDFFRLIFHPFFLFFFCMLQSFFFSIFYPKMFLKKISVNFQNFQNSQNFLKFSQGFKKIF